jgi:hypothetical protein
MLQDHAYESGLAAKLEAVRQVFLIHCYNQGVSPTISALEAYTRKSPADSAFYS